MATVAELTRTIKRARAVAGSDAATIAITYKLKRNRPGKASRLKAGTEVVRYVRPYEIGYTKRGRGPMLWATDTIHGSDQIHMFYVSRIQIQQDMGGQRFRPHWPNKIEEGIDRSVMTSPSLGLLKDDTTYIRYPYGSTEPIKTTYGEMWRLSGGGGVGAAGGVGSGGGDTYQSPFDRPAHRSGSAGSRSSARRLIRKNVQHDPVGPGGVYQEIEIGPI